METGKLHVISTGKQDAEQLAAIMSVIHPYVDFLHIREKTKTAKEIYEIAELLVNKKVPQSKIIINDRLDVASALRLRGVQLAHHSLRVDMAKRTFPALAIGCSVHSIEEAKTAEMHGADYVIFGHVYATSSKAGVMPKGLEQLHAVCSAVSIPVVAIGGIKPQLISEVIQSKAQGAAVMSGVLEAPDSLAAVLQYRSRLDEAKLLP